MFFKKNKGYITIFLSENKAIISFISNPQEQKPLEIFKHDVEDTLELNSIIEKDIEIIKETYNIAPKECIFFLNSFFIDSNFRKIKSQFIDEFRTLTENFKLNALGYIETQEAIGKYEKKEKIAIIEIDTTQVTGYILKNSEVEISLNKKYSGDKLKDIKELLQDLKITGKEDKIIFVFFHSYPSLKDEIKNLDLPSFLPIKQIPETEIISMDKANEILINIFLSEINKNEITKEKTNSKDTKTNEQINISETLPLGFSEKDIEEINNLETPLGFHKEKNLGNIKNKIKLPSISLKLPKINLQKQRILILTFALLIPASLVISHELFYHKLTIKIIPETKNLNIEKEITIDLLKKYTEFENEKIEITETTSTSGEKIVGEKATGTITIYNFSGEKLTLKAGTKINIKGKTFLTKNEVTLNPSIEETIGDSIVRKPTQKDVEIEAADIGEEYNVSTNEKIPIASGDIDLYYAKIKISPSGGSSEKLKTASKIDFQKLKEKVLEKAKTNVKKENIEDKLYLPELSEIIIENEEFDKEIGEVTNQLKIKATVNIKNAFITKQQLLNLVRNDIQEKISKEWIYLPEKSNIHIEKIKDEIFRLNANLYTIKNINTTSIPKEIKFKNIETAKKIIESKEGIKEALIKFHRSLIPFTPIKTQNIIIEL